MPAVADASASGKLPMPVVEGLQFFAGDQPVNVAWLQRYPYQPVAAIERSFRWVWILMGAEPVELFCAQLMLTGEVLEASYLVVDGLIAHAGHADVEMPVF